MIPERGVSAAGLRKASAINAASHCLGSGAVTRVTGFDRCALHVNVRVGMKVLARAKKNEPTRTHAALSNAECCADVWRPRCSGHVVTHRTVTSEMEFRLGETLVTSGPGSAARPPRPTLRAVRPKSGRNRLERGVRVGGGAENLQKCLFVSRDKTCRIKTS